MKAKLLVLTLVMSVTAHAACTEEVLKSREKPSDDTLSSAAWECVDNLSGKIAKGNSKAISQGVELLKVSDAGYTESIKLALSYALEKNPKEVLYSINGDNELLKFVCSMNFIEPEQGFLDTYYKNTTKMLSLIKGYRAMKCASDLNESYRLIKNAIPAQN